MFFRTLVDSKQNTKGITFALNRIEGLWKIVYKFFLDQEIGGLPVTVFITTDSITQKMNDITQMYEQITPAVSSE